MFSVEAFQQVSTPALLPKFRILSLRRRSSHAGVTTVTETINDHKYANTHGIYYQRTLNGSDLFGKGNIKLCVNKEM
jgi:hypothetical protein